jgi:hypothetical protein
LAERVARSPRYAPANFPMMIGPVEADAAIIRPATSSN